MYIFIVSVIAGMAANDIELEFDEDRGGPRHPCNFLSFPSAGAFFKATEHIWPWTTAGAHDANRKVVPSAFVEALFARAPVPDPEELKPLHMMVKCLDTHSFLVPALQLLVDEGLLEVEDEDGSRVERVFVDPSDLQVRADDLVGQLRDDPVLEVGATSFEWLEGFTNRAQDADIAWLHALDLCEVTRRTGDMQAYAVLTLVLGARSTEAVRIDPSGIFNAMVGGGQGGQLCDAIKAFYYAGAMGGAGAPVLSPQFLLRRLVDFFLDTEWPKVYKVSFKTWEEYAFDLANRALWKTATRQQWAAIVQGRLALAMKRHLPTLEELFHDYLDYPTTLVRETQSLGDLALLGDDAQKLPFWNIERVESVLAKDYAGLIHSERLEGKDTAQILEKVVERLKGAKAVNKTSEGRDDEDLRGPKPGQLTRALADADYSKVEVKYLEAIQRHSMTTDDKLDMLRDCLTAGTVLTHAVLFATKGVRMSVYTGQASTDFLAMLHDERHNMSLYLGQSLAYDPDLGRVPEDLRTFLYDEKQTELTCNLQWEALDPLNGCVLKLRGETAGTTFLKHSVTNVYHDGDMLTHVQDLYGRKFECLGYPREVRHADGYSFRGYIAEIKQIQRFSLGLTAGEQKNCFVVIDDFVLRGYTAASKHAKRVIYGASPADRRLNAWLTADEPVVIELRKLLEEMKSIASWRRRTGAIFGDKPTAATLPGFGHHAAGAGSSSRAQGGSSNGGNTSNGGSTSSTPRAPQASGSNKGSSKKAKGKAKVVGGQGAIVPKKPSGSVVKDKGIFVYDDESFSIGTRTSRARLAKRAHAPGCRAAATRPARMPPRARRLMLPGRREIASSGAPAQLMSRLEA